MPRGQPVNNLGVDVVLSACEVFEGSAACYVVRFGGTLEGSAANALGSSFVRNEEPGRQARPGKEKMSVTREHK